MFYFNIEIVESIAPHVLQIKIEDTMTLFNPPDAVHSQHNIDVRKPNRVQLIFILGALSTFGPLSTDMYLPSLPSLSHDFGTGAAQAQLTLSTCFLGLAIGQIIAGPISDEMGRYRPLLMGLAAFALASFLLHRCMYSFCCVLCRVLGVRLALSLLVPLYAIYTKGMHLPDFSPCSCS